jgi:RNA polymerase sigma factor (TIGR02999 family)
MSDLSPSVTVLLVRWREGDRAALDALTPLVYDNLRRIAARHLARERSGFTLCATEVVHEAYEKLAGADIPWQDRAHFLAIASRQMRQVLVDYARTRGRQKRGGNEWQRVTFAGVEEAAKEEQVDILSI